MKVSRINILCFIAVAAGIAVCPLHGRAGDGSIAKPPADVVQNPNGVADGGENGNVPDANVLNDQLKKLTTINQNINNADSNSKSAEIPLLGPVVESLKALMPNAITGSGQSEAQQLIRAAVTGNSALDNAKAINAPANAQTPGIASPPVTKEIPLPPSPAADSQAAPSVPAGYKAPPALPETEDTAGEAVPEGKVWSDSDADKKFQGNNFESLSRKGELMMKESDMEKIYKALNGVIIKNENAGKTEIVVNKVTVAPTFFIKSVLYFSPANWSVWLNDRKFTPFYNKQYSQAGDVDFEIASVREDKVVLVWNTQNLDVIAPGWRDKFIYRTLDEDRALSEPGYVSPSGNIFVNSNIGMVQVSIAPNQTFVSAKMDVEEGYIAPIPVLVREDQKDKQEDSKQPGDIPNIKEVNKP